EDGRIVIVKAAIFMLQTADTFDTGLYHCIGTNHNDADTLTFRITVVDPYVEHNSVNGAQLSTFVGSTLYLPCTSTAVPDAAISWVSPQHVILHHSVRNKHIFENGTLRIQGVTERDSGYFRCVAANQYGVDLLVFQVLVRKDETTLKKKHIAVGGWEEGDGSGDAVLASATTQKHPLATLATSTANQESAASASRNLVGQSAHKRNSYGKMPYRHYRDRLSRQFRGHRRQFVPSARRVDPQRWAAFLEKTKRNSTSTEKHGEVATKPPIQVQKFSKVPRDEEETSGDPLSPEEEFIPVTETATVSALGRATENVVTAGPEMTMSNTPARKTSLLVAEAVTPLPSPLSQSVSSDSRPQTYLKPTITNLWERPDLSQISANGMKQSTVSNGASRTSAVLPAGQRLEYSGESSNQRFKPVSPRPVADATDPSRSVTSQNAVDKPHVFTESVGKISTKINHQISAVTVSEPSPELEHIYFHSTQKPVTPKPPLDSAVITHQQIQIIGVVTTPTPQAQQQYERRRKISGRRRIVRPGRIPSMKEQRSSFGRPGSVRGSTAVAADLQLNIKYASNLPALNNLSSSANPFSPEAPLSSPSIMNVPLEHPAGTYQTTAFLREEENKPSARQKAATTVVPLITKGTRDTPQWKLETSAPFQTSTDGVQPFSIRQPTMAIHTAHITTEVTHTTSTKVSSPPESDLPSTKPGTSAQNSQRGKITWEHLFGNDAQKEVLQRLPKQQTDTFLSTEVSTVLPETTAASPTSTVSPWHFLPLAAGGNHSSGFWSLNKPVHYDNGKSEEHCPTAELQSYSNPATTATKEMDVPSLKPTVTPVITPQSDTKVTRSKTFRVGRKRGQRRRRPPKTSTSQSVSAGAAAVDPATPVATTGQSFTTPTGPPSAEPLSASTGTLPGTGTPAPRVFSTPGAPPQRPAAAPRPPAAPGAGRNSHPATAPRGSPRAQSPPTPLQTPPLLSRPFSATGTGCATPGSEPAPQTRAPATAGETSHPEEDESAAQGDHVARPTFPASAEPRTRAPAAPAAVSPAPAQHPAPLP
ncbi:IGS10 protein, partial [Podargus strigoides]|nr:IGS10 protein [Podargus strigoides]